MDRNESILIIDSLICSKVNCLSYFEVLRISDKFSFYLKIYKLTMIMDCKLNRTNFFSIFLSIQKFEINDASSEWAVEESVEDYKSWYGSSETVFTSCTLIEFF